MSRLPVAAAFAAVLALAANASAEPTRAATAAPPSTVRATTAPRYRGLEKMLHRFCKPMPAARSAFFAAR